jgi:hypothetical protein
MGSDGTSNTVTRAVVLIAVNDRPVLVKLEDNPLVFTKLDTEKAVTATILVSDADLRTRAMLAGANWRLRGIRF